MNYLLIDTSREHLTVIVNANGRESVKYIEACTVKHSTLVMEKVEECLEETGLTLKDVDFYVSVIGPGSFTGIRIGVSTIKALAFSQNKRVLGITSFDVIAYNELDGKNLAVIDAKHNNFYVCGYDDLKVVLDARFVNLETLNELKKEYNVLHTENLEFGKKVSVVEGAKKAVELLKDNLILPDSLTPLYIRKSQAEENR